MADVDIDSLPRVKGTDLQIGDTIVSYRGKDQTMTVVETLEQKTVKVQMLGQMAKTIYSGEYVEMEHTFVNKGIHEYFIPYDTRVRILPRKETANG